MGWCGRRSSVRSTGAGSESEFVSVADTPRATFAKHPWSIGGGGAAELKEQLNEAASVASLAPSRWVSARNHSTPARTTSSSSADACAPASSTVEAYCSPVLSMGTEFATGPLCLTTRELCSLTTADPTSVTSTPATTAASATLWPVPQPSSRQRSYFGSRLHRGRDCPWYEYSDVLPRALPAPLSIAFALGRYAQPLCPRPRRQGVQADGAGDQAAGRQ